MTTTSQGPEAAATGPMIPAENLTRWHASIADELRAAFEEVLPVGKYTLGKQLAAFEEEFATYSDSSHGIGISSGTAALHLALRALGVGPGDEVITVPNTYVATVFAISYTGATPVFVDVDPVTANLDPARIPAALSERTKAIVPVHLYGQCVDVDAVRAAAPGVPILEDAAHAHGATLGRPQGRRPGRRGRLQLLPVQGAGRARRRRHSSPPPRTSWPRASDSCATWARRAPSTSTWCWASRNASTSCRRRSCGSSSGAWKHSSLAAVGWRPATASGSPGTPLTLPAP